MRCEQVCVPYCVVLLPFFSNNNKKKLESSHDINVNEPENTQAHFTFYNFYNFIFIVDFVVVEPCMCTRALCATLRGCAAGAVRLLKQLTKSRLLSAECGKRHGPR